MKNWATGFVSAAIFSGYVAKLPWWPYPSYLLIVAAFWLLEKYQESLQEGFSHRVRVLEREMRRTGTAVFSEPLKVRYHNVPDLTKLPPSSPSDAVYLAVMQLRRLKGRWFVLHSDEVFYLILCMLVIFASFVAWIRQAPVPSIDI